jgi:NTP pyrophosphatase (non-canonical NTP hydrolase)
MKISEIQKHAEDLCRKNGWLDRSPDQRFRYLISEIGELSNDLIKLNQPDQEIGELKRKIGHEMYDVIWNICDLANLLEIDLEKFSIEKNDLNNQRNFDKSNIL